MARGTVTPKQLSSNAGGTAPAFVNIDTTNGLVIPAGGLTRNMFIRVKNNGGTAGTVGTSGTYPPAFRSGQGSVLVTVPANGESFICLESARVDQADGSINLDFTPASFTGTVDAYILPADI